MKMTTYNVSIPFKSMGAGVGKTNTKSRNGVCGIKIYIIRN
jgi:hypothetical protein